MSWGIATAARIPIIATTIISSMSVNPLWIFFMLSIGIPLRHVRSKQRAIYKHAGSNAKRAEAFCCPSNPEAENCHRARRTSLDALVLFSLVIVALVDPELRQPITHRPETDPEQDGRTLPDAARLFKCA